MSSCYGLMDVVKQWRDTFLPLLKPKFSEEAGNKKAVEGTTCKAFLDVIEYCFNDGMCI